ncbi:MAG: ATP-binding cassette domain-containing protein [Oscillospiraceae bacterium]|nr:ATP-binding cassette domain-containing protein [Oscillospiraceae bacterium]
MSLFVDIEKKLGDFTLRVQFEAGDETLALFGASGCGKSMTLKCIAGVEKPDRGRIVCGDTVFFDSERKIDLPPQKRRVGFLFQSYALFPNMTVRQNISAGVRTLRGAAREERVEKVLRTMRIAHIANQYPRTLSGGEQQRTALARILVNEPQLLLLDEPFSALDSHLRFELEREVGAISRSFGKTALLVSHDRGEVFRLCDSIAVMHAGEVELVDTKSAVFENPRTKNAALLTHCRNISRIEQLGEDRIRALDWGVELTVTRDFTLARYVAIRPHNIALGSEENAVRCRLVQAVNEPFSAALTLVTEDGGEIFWETDKATCARAMTGEVNISFPPQALLPLF